MSYIAVIGAGSWGTTLASLLAEKGYEVTLWSHDPEHAERMKTERENSMFHAGYQFPPLLSASGDGTDIEQARYIISVVPTQFIRPVFTRLAPHINRQAILVSASKGIENTTLLTPSMVLQEITGRIPLVLSGPSFAREVAEKKPTAVTLATADKAAGLLLQEIFNTDYFRVYTHDDIAGVEIGGAIKNVIAIASGICEGLGLGSNARAALITRGLTEIVRLGLKLKAREITFSGLSGLGDLVLTCTDMQSRNFSLGYRLGQGMTLSEIMGATHTVAEGYPTALSVQQLSQRHSIEMPIAGQVYQVLYNAKSPAAAVKELMTRTLKAEFHG